MAMTISNPLEDLLKLHAKDFVNGCRACGEIRGVYNADHICLSCAPKVSFHLAVLTTARGIGIASERRNTL